MTHWTVYLNIVGDVILGLLAWVFYRKFSGQKIEKNKLLRRMVELQELDHTKQVFLSSVAHQMRTPLAGAKWALEEVLKDKNCPHLDLVAESHKRLEQAIGNITKILKAAELKIDSADIEIKKESFNLKDLIQKILTDLAYLSTSKKTKIKYEKFDPILVQGDPEMLDIALANIFDNAIRYSPKGEVRINLFVSRAEAVLTVEDSGVGIDPKDLEFISFQKFYRGKNAMTIDPNESGVGLYVTRKIIEIHGGRIAISSTLGRGTKVSVALPVAISA